MERRKFLKDVILTTTGVLLVPAFLKGNTVQTINTMNTTIDAKSNGKKFVHFWSKCVGAGRANEGLRATWLEHLKLSKELCGFQYCRFHGLLHDDMFVYKEVNDKVIYNWQYLDDLFDRMLEIGVKPFVELAFMPKDLATDETSLQFWWKGHITPPKDPQKWFDLVTELVKHCISRYGTEEVRSWYFEVWNEPNIKPFWNATQEQYFELYKISAKAIKAVDAKLKVGGPATSAFHLDNASGIWKGSWVEEFLAYCKKENLPLDFLSTHPYPAAKRIGNATQQDMLWLKNTMATSAYPNAEIHLSEWSSSSNKRDRNHDYLPAAAFVIKMNLESIGLADSLSYWVFSDLFEESGAGDTIFHGGFGLINYQGIVKPAFHGYRMLNQLGDEILHQEDGMIVTRNSSTKKLSTLVYHYPPEITGTLPGTSKANAEKTLNTGIPKKFTLQLNNLHPASAITLETLDGNNGNAIVAWEKMGSPEPPTREQTKELKNLAMATKNEKAKADSRGNFKWEKTLDPWTCILIKQD